MAVEIVNVQRVNGRAVAVLVRIDDIEVNYVRVEGSNKHDESSRSRDGVQVLDERHGVCIPPGELPELYKKINAIFDEDRSKSKPQKRNLKVLQEKLF